MRTKVLGLGVISAVALIAVAMPALSAVRTSNGAHGTPSGKPATGMTGGMKATKTIRIVMHDPGCHWFSVNGKLKTRLSVNRPVALVNYDIATLKAVGPRGVKRTMIRHALGGKPVTFGPGSYTITMVGMPPDDNTLKLVVN